MKTITAILLLLFPSSIRRLAYSFFFGYKIDKTAFIGRSIILCDSVDIGPNARVGHLTVIKGLALLRLADNSRIGNLNWITGFPKHLRTSFSEEVGRNPSLLINRHASITHRHLIDCTDQVSIGSFTTFAGWNSQILTHSIDIENCRQSCAPVNIGDYCFIGGRSTVLKGSCIDNFIVTAAGSVISNSLNRSYTLYGGVPCKPIKDIPQNAGYFIRKIGGVK